MGDLIDLTPNNKSNNLGTGINIQNAIETAPCETCECGNKIWASAVVLKKLNKLISPSGNDELVPISVFICSRCGELAPMFKNDNKFNKLISD